MKQNPLKIFFAGLTVMALIVSGTALAASTGTIDPSNTGAYKAAFLDTGVVSDTSINFGKFTTQSQYNITVSDTALRGYAWGASVGWIVTNCADTTSGCSSTNGNFKIANNAGLLSGYAWGENTGWINFGPFSDPAVSTVKIGSDGNFGGTSGSAGYAWSQNYGWIKFDCTSPNTCVHTDWTASSGGTGGPGNGSGGVSGGGAAGGSGNSGTGAGTVTPTGPTSPANPASPTNPSTTDNHTSPDNGNQSDNQPPAHSEPVIDEPTQAPGDENTQPSDNPAQSQSEPSPFDNFSLPPTLSESIGGIVGTITNAGKTIVEALSIVTTPAGKIVTKTASAVGIVATFAAGIAAMALANPISLAELLLLPFRLWSLLLIAFGLKKRNRPWGTVYDSVTKQPIDPAYVMLTDLQGNEVATSITDIDGRYGFVVAPGIYKLVANKTNFEFPSKKLAGRSEDELYGNLYFGDTVEIKEQGEIIAKNIPLDQQNFDWNEFAKNEQQRLSYYRHSDVVIARISTIFFWFGFVVAAIALLFSHNAYNSIIFILYVVMFIIRHYSPQFKVKGSVTAALTDQPLSFAIIHVLSVATGQEITHKVADRLGNYYGLMPNGTYNIVIDRKNPDASYTKIPVAQPVVVRDGYLQESFKV